jgi:hypothetical protein
MIRRRSFEAALAPAATLGDTLIIVQSTRTTLLLTLFSALALPVTLTGCTGSRAASAASATVATPSQQATDEARKQLDLIPPPSKTRYMAVKSLTSWENPYLTVQGGMVTLHVMMADANTSGMGDGGMLRPVGARRQDLNIRIGELPEALDAVPESAWPYGRVVAVEEAHDIPTSARPGVRRNMETVMKTLGDLGVVVYEWSDSGPGLK